MNAERLKTHLKRVHKVTAEHLAYLTSQTTEGAIESLSQLGVHQIYPGSHIYEARDVLAALDEPGVCSRATTKDAP